MNRSSDIPSPVRRSASPWACWCRSGASWSPRTPAEGAYSHVMFVVYRLYLSCGRLPSAKCRKRLAGSHSATRRREPDALADLPAAQTGQTQRSAGHIWMDPPALQSEECQKVSSNSDEGTHTLELAELPHVSWHSAKGGIKADACAPCSAACWQSQGSDLRWCRLRPR